MFIFLLKSDNKIYVNRVQFSFVVTFPGISMISQNFTNFTNFSKFHIFHKFLKISQISQNFTDFTNFHRFLKKFNLFDITKNFIYLITCDPLLVLGVF